MHVLVMTQQYRPDIKGGVGIVAASLADAYLSHGCDVTVVAETTRSRTPSVSVHGRLRIIRLPPGSRELPHRYRAAADVVHAHSYRTAALAVATSRALNCPLVYTCHSFAKSEPLILRRRMLAGQLSLLRAARIIVAPSHWTLRALAEQYPGCAGKSVAIANGVAIPPQAAEPLHASPSRLLYVGRAVRAKGLTELVQALPTLARHRPDVSLTVVGYDTGGERQRLERLARRAGVDRRIRWLGGRQHSTTLSLYRRYGAVVMPSRMETFGLVALEALAHGVPLVATRNGGLADFISDDVASVIHAVSARDIAAAVLAMWLDPGLTARRVANGISLARSHSIDATAERYLHLFAGLAAGAAAGK